MLWNMRVYVSRIYICMSRAAGDTEVILKHRDKEMHMFTLLPSPTPPFSFFCLFSSCAFTRSVVLVTTETATRANSLAKSAHTLKQFRYLGALLDGWFRLASKLPNFRERNQRQKVKKRGF